MVLFLDFFVDITGGSFGCSIAVSGKFVPLIFPTQNNPTRVQINNPTQQIEIVHSNHMKHKCLNNTSLPFFVAYF